MKPKIYQQEIVDGLETVISQNNSLAFDLDIIKSERKIEVPKIVKSLSKEQQFDLFYLDAILASTGWNKNDDVVTGDNLWSARATPVDKQFNYMHDEDDIIGHIIGSYVVDKDGNILDENTKELPELFDVVASAVIYREFVREDRKNRIEKLIAEILEGKWFVSMECLFNDFDYAIISEDNTHKTVERTEASCFLTKHLKAYGGSGKYNGKRVGRLIKNMVFSGKGLVDKPANPRSVILQDSFSFNGTQASIEIFQKGEGNMPEAKTELDKLVEKLEADLVTAKNENKELLTKLSENTEKAVTAKVTALEAQVSELTKAGTEKDAEVTSLKTKFDEVNTKLTEKVTAMTELQTKYDTLSNEVIKSKRTSQLVSAGLTAEKADELVKSFANVDDETFGKLVEISKASIVTAPAEDDDDEDEEVEVSKTTATEATLAADAGSQGDVKATLSSWIKKNVLKTTASLKEGE